MTNKQKVVLLVGIAVMVGMMLYPPWYGKALSGGLATKGNPVFFGYSPLFRPKKSPLIIRHKAETIYETEGTEPGVLVGYLRIDKDLLVVQCLIVALITGGLIVVLGDKRRP